MSNIEDAARGGSLVIFAGAGVSSGPPTSLPGWKPLNAAIFRVLRTRLETGIERKDWLAQLESFLESERTADRFPPDYQAQIIEEMCGERYFRALQALDVDVTNSAHENIAALAAAGAVQAIITTNFDRLIEHALDRRGVSYEAAYAPDGFRRLRDQLPRHGGAVPIIKIHGCVCDHLSMIDTLKQRRKGRSRAVEECLERLYPGYWVYVGFSAADLETDGNYLGLVNGASRSTGATYVAYPGRPELGTGAKILMAAYDTRATVVVADSGTFLEEICRGMQRPEMAPAPSETGTGTDQFREKLDAWASGLSLAATGLCLAGIMEAAGQSEPAARILDRLARKEIFEERGTPDFEALQLQYGRLGAAFGRFINVPDLNGAQSNASVEAVQSLLRLQHTGAASRAAGWMPCLYLWLNYGEAAMDLARSTMRGFVTDEWGTVVPQTDEEAVDAWIAAAQVFLINTHQKTIEVIVGTFRKALERARRSGDVVRTARVIALYLLAMAETKENVPSLAAEYEPDFGDMMRVRDGFAMGFLALALGRWHTGPGGLAAAKESNDLESTARRALEYLDDATTHLRNQSMDPWLIFAAVQQAKALADLRQLEAVSELFQRATPELERFPVFASHMHEAAGQIQLATGDPEAAASFRNAVATAEQSGLLLRRELLMHNYHAHIGLAAASSDAPGSDRP